jgi:hypothetical protein
LSRLQIAQRLFQLLLLELDHSIELERLLGDPRYARDVLLVCDACTGSELQAQAAMFRASAPPVGRRAGDTPAAGLSARTVRPTPPQPAGRGPAPRQLGSPGRALQANAWSRDTSGFGVSRPASTGTSAAGAPSDSAPVAPDLGAPVPARRLSWLPRWTQR